MHTTTGEKKTLGRRARGQESVGVLFDGDVCTYAFVPASACTCVYVCVYFWDKELCKHEFTNRRGRGEEDIIAPDPGLGQVTQSGTSLAQSFLLVTLQVTSTSMRYDRYDTLRFHVRTRNLNVVQIVVQESPVPRLAKILQLFPLSFPGFRARAREREKGEGKKREGKEKKRRGGKNVKNVREETSERIDRNEQRESFSSP